MPLYEYRLSNGSVVERYRSIGDRNAPLPEDAGAVRLPSRSHFRSETIFRDHPVTGERTVYNDCDDPWEGTKYAGWGQEKSKEFVAQKRELEVQLGKRDRMANFERKRMVFDQGAGGNP